MQCSDRCLVKLPDGTTICVLEIVNAYPHGAKLKTMATILGLTKQGVEYAIGAALKKVARRGLAK